MSSLINALKSHFETILKDSVAAFSGENGLKKACIYAVSTPGKRFRPLLVYLVARSLGCLDNLDQAALAVEYFHTASLIADDLPCMDDDPERRERSSLHIEFNEATALLTTYALIAAGYEALARQPAKDPELNRLATLNASENSGISGATGGQFLDLNSSLVTPAFLEEVIKKKTVSLFEISFVFGWLFGGGAPELLPSVKQLSMHFGMAFQLADDLDDADQDEISLAILLGEEKTRMLMEHHMKSFADGLSFLKMDPSPFISLWQGFSPARV